MNLVHGVAQDIWFQVQWDSKSHDLPIAVKELIPIILAWYEATAGEASKSNATVIIRWWWHACSLEQAKNKSIMHMLCCMVFIEAHFQFDIHPTYINTKVFS